MNPRIAALLLMGLAPALAPAAGYYLPNQDAFATARGNAFLATADSAAAVFYNPAGLTQLISPEVQVGAYTINLGNQIQTATGRYKAKSEIQSVPHLYFGQPLSDRLAWGFGLNCPYGLGNDWGEDSPFRSVVTEARLAYFSATLALAYEVTDTLSIGASVSGNYADLLLEQGLTPFSDVGFLRFTGDGTALSAMISARWQPSERHAFGLVIASDSSMHLDGRVDSDFLGDSTAEMEFATPFRIAAGYSYRPAPGWNLEANVEWLDWDSINSFTLDARALPGGTTAVPFNWQSMFIYELGISYTTLNGYRFALGYDYNSNAQPNADYNPAVSDGNFQYINLGVGRKMEKFDWFLTYQFGFANHEVKGSQVSPAGQSADGKYEGRHHAVVLSCAYRF